MIRAPFRLVVAATAATLTFVILKTIGAIVPLRVSRGDEVMDLDVSQHGEALQ